MSPSTLTTRSRVLAVGVLCAAGGVGAGAIADATASTGTSHAKAGHHAKHHRGLARRGVAGSVVVHGKDGFRTITFERGTVKSVSGDQLTIAEGTAKDTYKTVTVTVPSDAHVRDNGQKSSLSSVTDGQRVLVVQGPKRTAVRAHTPGFRKSAAQQ